MAEELKRNYIRYHKTADGKHKGVSLEFANEIEMDSFLEEYAQQVSRDTAYLFWGWVHKTKSHDQRLRYSFDELWNQWKLNQNQQ